MAPVSFYPGDTVSLKSDSTKIAIVDRTHGHPENHDEDPLHLYQNGLVKGPRVASRDYAQFLHNGIPPKGTIVISWAHLPWSSQRETMLLKESDVRLEDRELLEGDIIKKSPESSVSGVVARAYTEVTLLPSARWPNGEIPPAATGRHSFRNNFPSRPESQLLRKIPSDELVWPNTYQLDNFILYSGWVGRIEDIAEEPLMRLADKSIVSPENPRELQAWTDPVEDSFIVGDFFEAKKAQLRRGRWIYGQYDANVTPEGYVASVRQSSITVDWLQATTFGDNEPPMPPGELESSELDSGAVLRYNRRKRPTESSRALNFDLVVGDRVRFHDLPAAAAKYDGSTEHGKLDRILRSEASGYDINVFLVVGTHTLVDVDWQDGTKDTGLEARSLAIPLEFDVENIVPGDLVCYTADTDGEGDVVTCRHVGVVQTIDSKEQIANVCWMKDAELSYLNDSIDMSLLPESWTSEVGPEPEEVSLYDIVGMPALARRIGDYVAIIPGTASVTKHDSSWYDDVRWVSNEQLKYGSNDCSWFGEIIAVGLDGLLTVRLGACDPPQDKRIPWENTHLVWSSDMENEDEDSEYSDGTQSDTSDMESTTSAEQAAPQIPGIIASVGNTISEHIRRALHPRRRDQSNDDEPVSDSEWMTEDEDVPSDIEVLSEAPEEQPSAVDEGGDSIMGGIPPAVDEAEAASRTIEKVIIIDDSNIPTDHKYANEPHNLVAKQQRRLDREFKILRESLPGTCFFRSWESALDCARVLILGPMNTPYEYAPFVFDLQFTSDFPTSPPLVYFHSWTGLQGAVNPNLYTDGKVCLSLLNTWPGDEKKESWTTESTILQIIVSLQAIVLNADPYYNEAGYEVRRGLPESLGPARQYAEKAYIFSRGFISHALKNDVGGFEKEIEQIYRRPETGLLTKAIASAENVINRSRTHGQMGDASPDQARVVSKGGLPRLTRAVEELASLVREDVVPDEA